MDARCRPRARAWSRRWVARARGRGGRHRAGADGGARRRRGQAARARPILWLDVRADVGGARARRGARAWRRAEAIGGNRMHAYFLGPKLAWLRAHEPESARARGVGAAVARLRRDAPHRRGGVRSLDGDAVRAALRRAGGALVGGGCARGGRRGCASLPRIARAHDVLGRVTARGRRGDRAFARAPRWSRAAATSRRARSAPASSSEGQACLMLGTAGNLLMPMREPRFDSRLINSHHVGSERWLALGGTLCGAALEWFRRACAPGVAVGAARGRGERDRGGRRGAS